MYNWSVDEKQIKERGEEAYAIWQLEQMVNSCLGNERIKVEEAKDYPRMILQLADADWKGFFLAEAKK